MEQLLEMLNKADSISIIWAPKFGRHMFQAFDVPDSLTQEPQLIGGGELSMLIYWLSLLLQNEQKLK